MFGWGIQKGAKRGAPHTLLTVYIQQFYYTARSFIYYKLKTTTYNRIIKEKSQANITINIHNWRKE
jgi:hypothetical protein